GRDEARAEGDDDRDLRPGHEQREDVAPRAVRAEQVRPARAEPRRVRVGAARAERCPDERDERREADERDDRERDAPHGDPQQAGEPAHARSLCLGSSAWCTRSTTKPMTSTKPVSTSSSPCTFTRSRAPTSVTSMRPMPGSVKTCSMTTAPTRMPAICSPSTVMTDRPTDGRP